MDRKTADELNEIRKLLAEMYKDYFQGPDPMCKSGEGTIELLFPAFFWDECSPKRPSVSVYSYVFGPNRNHYFDDATRALQAVKDWHRSYFDGWREQYYKDGMEA